MLDSEWYFAYGSNMNPNRMIDRGLQWREVHSGWMDGVQLCFNKSSLAHPAVGHANIRVPSEFQCGEESRLRQTRVEGVLYRLTSPLMIAKLDRFEHTPINYSRELFAISSYVNDSSLEQIYAWTYIANPAVLKEGLLPDATYLSHLLAGKPWLTGKYHATLQATPVFAPQ